MRVARQVSRRIGGTAAALALSLALAASGCTKGCSPEPSSSTGERAVADQKGAAKGHPALQFDYKKATELLISKADPQSGDRWTTRIVRQDESSWRIEMGPDEIASGDRRAHGTFILHLLDTMRTLQLKPAGVSGAPESFGLNPPLFMLRWKVAGEGSAPSSEFEIRFGSPAKASDGAFEGLYATLPSAHLSGESAEPTVFIANGAGLRMLEMLSSFSQLRLQTLATFESDDIDEIEIPGTFYAQRDGDHWSDARHRPYKKDVGGFLDQVAHLRIARFVDDPREQAPLANALSRHPLHKIVFKDRRGSPVTLRLIQGHGNSANQVFADLSTRAKGRDSAGEGLAVFEVYPQILKALATLTHP